MSSPGADLLDRLLDACPAPVIVADLRGRILLFNPAAEAVLGYQASEAHDHLHVTDLYHRPDDARRVLRRLRDRPAGSAAGRDVLEVMLRARNGELIPVRLTAALVHDDGGTPVATLGVFEDRRESIALGRRLEDATDQVMASERRIAGMVVAARVAHDLSQPLTAAMGNLEMILLVDDVPPRVAERIQRTWEQMERMGRIIQDFTRVTAETRGSVADDEEGAE